MIKNYMELLVDEVYNEVRKGIDHCMTEECVEDIKSKALNQLPPKYFTSDSDDSEKKAFLLDRQRRISVLAKIAEAIEYNCSDCNNKRD